MTNKELEELIKSGKVEFFDANNIIPSIDLDSYDYNLFLKFASQKELEEDSFTSETFKKIEEYKIQGGKSAFENGLGCFSLTPEERVEVIRKVGLQKWRCLVTGYVSNSGNLSQFQKKNGIDTSLRERIE